MTDNIQTEREIAGFSRRGLIGVGAAALGLAATAAHVLLSISTAGSNLLHEERDTLLP